MKLKYAQYYNILQEVGKGSFGKVYEAVDTRINRRVAIKAIHPKFVTNENIRLNCLKEANGYLSLRDHPNIVDLVDLVKEQDAIYIVMDYIDGMTLEDYVNMHKQSGQVISYNVIQHIFNQILSAIGYAHQKDIIHLDIKPGNILLEGNLKVKVVDFGISKSLKELSPTHRVGTPIYMSPEQVLMEKLDKTTDIYAIGLTMLTTLLGESIYRNMRTEDQLFDQILNFAIEDSLQKYSWIDSRLRHLIVKSTSKKKENRFLSCQEFQYYLNN